MIITQKCDISHTFVNIFSFNGKIKIGEGYMFENNLKTCREDLELTQKELGKVFGVSDKTIANWENSYDTMPLEKVIKFCNLYNYSVDYVLGLDKKNTIYNNNIVLDKKNLGNKLRRIRKELNLTQKEVADKCSISRSTLTYYELGKNLITTRNLYIFCKINKLSADELLNRKRN